MVVCFLDIQVYGVNTGQLEHKAFRQFFEVLFDIHYMSKCNAVA